MTGAEAFRTGLFQGKAPKNPDSEPPRIRFGALTGAVTDVRQGRRMLCFAGVLRGSVLAR